MGSERDAFKGSWGPWMLRNDLKEVRSSKIEKTYISYVYLTRFGGYMRVTMPFHSTSSFILVQTFKALRKRSCTATQSPCGVMDRGNVASTISIWDASATRCICSEYTETIRKVEYQCMYYSYVLSIVYLSL